MHPDEPRKTRQRFEISNDARFLTFSCFQRLPLFTNDRIKDSFIDALRASRDRMRYQLLAWVVMPEHVHLLIVPDIKAHPVSRILSELKGGFANVVLRRWRTLNAPILTRLNDVEGKQRFWQPGGGFDRNIVSSAEYEEKMNYIHENPKQRGLVDDSLTWRWSSAAWYAGMREEGAIEPDVVLI